MHTDNGDIRWKEEGKVKDSNASQFTRGGSEGKDRARGPCIVWLPSCELVLVIPGREFRRTACDKVVSPKIGQAALHNPRTNPLLDLSMRSTRVLFYAEHLRCIPSLIHEEEKCCQVSRSTVTPAELGKQKAGNGFS